MKDQKIKVSKNGPYLVTGDVPLKKEVIGYDEDGEPLKWNKDGEIKTPKEYSLCRCGKSKNKPFCDGSHIDCKFNGKETADMRPYEEVAGTLEGPDLILRDNYELCALLRFCHREGGVWNLVERSDDPEARKTAIEQCQNCVSGRLTAYDKKTGKAIEKKYTPSISVTQDPAKEVSGPLAIKGGIQIESADGESYECKNRCTLCRCGKSTNKPFCTGAHISEGFNDKE